MYRRPASTIFPPLRVFAVCSALLLGAAQEGYGQRVYANSQSIQSGSNPIYTPNNNISSGAVDPGHSGYTQWTALGGLNPNHRGLTPNSPSIVGQVSFTKVNDWNSLAIITRNTGISLGRASAISVYNKFDESPDTNCETASSTTTSYPILTSITNRELAIDNDLSSYSTFNATLSLGSTLSQTAYFSNLSNLGDAATVTFSVPPAALTLSLLDNFQIKVFNGSTEGEAIEVGSLLSLDLLGLLRNGSRYTVSFVPTLDVFDRIEVSVRGVSLLSVFRLHEIQRTPAKPTVPTAYPDVIEICDGETVSITAESPSPGSILRWYDAVNDGTLLQESTGNPDTYITPPIPYTAPDDTTFIYVAAAWDSGCPAESERTKIAIVIHPKPTVAPISGEDDVCVNDQIALSSGTVGGTWSSNDSNIASVNPSSGVVSGVAAGTVTIRYTVSDSETSCFNYQEKEITVHPKPNTPSIVTH